MFKNANITHMNSDQYRMLGVLRNSNVSTTTSWWSSPRRYRYSRILANTKFFSRNTQNSQ